MSKSFLSWAIVLIAVFFLSSSNGHAQVSGGKLTLQAGIVTFPNPEYDSLTLVESYFSVIKSEFQLFRTDSTQKNAARVFAQLDILDSTGKAIDSGTTYFAFEQEETKTNEPVAVFNKIALLLKPGIYSMRLTAIDAVGKREGEVFFPRVTVPQSEHASLSLGGLLIAEDLTYIGDEEGDIPGRLSKNGFKVLPNPLSVFTAVDSTAAVYGEIYNLSYDSTKPSSHTLSYRILKEDGSEYLSLGQKTRTTIGTSAVISEKFDIRNWPVGSYLLEVAVLDNASSQTDTIATPLHIIQPRIDLPDSVALGAASNAYDSLPLGEQVKIVMYLLTPEEKEAIGRLTATGQQNFLDQYWKEAGLTRFGKPKATKAELLERYRHVNFVFSTNEEKSNGYLTDRGRIYMTYGAPDELDDFPTPRTGNPYQVWNYRAVREGKFFVFEDKTGYSDYRLVHSNVSGEPFSSVWQDAMTNLLKQQDQD